MRASRRSQAPEECQRWLPHVSFPGEPAGIFPDLIAAIATPPKVPSGRRRSGERFCSTLSRFKNLVISSALTKDMAPSYKLLVLPSVEFTDKASLPRRSSRHFPQTRRIACCPRETSKGRAFNRRVEVN